MLFDLNTGCRCKPNEKVSVSITSLHRCLLRSNGSSLYDGLPNECSSARYPGERRLLDTAFSQVCRFFRINCRERGGISKNCVVFPHVTGGELNSEEIGRSFECNQNGFAERK